MTFRNTIIGQWSLPRRADYLIDQLRSQQDNCSHQLHVRATSNNMLEVYYTQDVPTRAYKRKDGVEGQLLLTLYGVGLFQQADGTETLEDIRELEAVA